MQVWKRLASSGVSSFIACSHTPGVPKSLLRLPTAIYLMATGSMTRGLVLVGLGAGVVGLVDNIVRPLLLSGPVHVSPRRWQRHGVIRQTLRNWRLLLAFNLGVSPECLAAQYRRHDA